MKKRKLTSQEAEEIRKLYAGGQNNLANIGKKYNVSGVTISKIVRGESYLDKPATEAQAFNNKKENNNKMKNSKIAVNNLLSLSEDELKNLPPELLKELSKTTACMKNSDIFIKIIEDNQKYITIDQLLIRLYRKSGRIFKRQTIYSILASLIKQGRLEKDRTRACTYFIPET